MMRKMKKKISLVVIFAMLLALPAARRRTRQAVLLIREIPEQ